MNNIIRYTIKSGDNLYIIASRYNTTVKDILAHNVGLNPQSIKVGQVIFVPKNINYSRPIRINRSVLGLNNLMRMLWEQHITWTRIVIMDIVYDLPETPFAINRLLRNPQDFGNAFRRFYGDVVAQRITVLFTEHLTLAADIVVAAKENNQARVEELNSQWFRNADDIAKLLASINPFWSFVEWQKMLYEHLELVTNEALNFINNRLEANVALYDEMERQALGMADTMTEGIVRQFSNLFGSLR
ncbi:MAG TPA: LysM peptidoglycan-binding domain-containing protein [Acholeplasmataceae bacterium]|nr:LysM peptidoglycan-binding domain-containing protein [Acholeplasmataceae bacterium]